MSNETREQGIEKEPKSIMGNTLSAEEWETKISKEIYFFPENLPFDTWHERVVALKEEIQKCLSQARTSQERSTLRFAYLFLQGIAGDMAEEFFNKPEKSLEYYQDGIERTQKFLKPGEIIVRGQEVLRLCLNAGITCSRISPPNVDQKLVYYKEGIKRAQEFLKQGEITVKGQETVLSLYFNAGITCSQISPPNVDQELVYYKEGIKRAQEFLKQGEITAKGQETILELYHNYSATLYDNGQVIDSTTFLPVENYWLWQVANQFITDKESRTAFEETHGKSQNALKIDLSHFEIFPDRLTICFQEFLHQLLTQWHKPEYEHKHRHIMPMTIGKNGKKLLNSTDILLRLSEGGYLLDEAKKKEWLTRVYQNLAIVEEENISVQWQQEIGNELERQFHAYKSKWEQLFPEKHVPETPLLVNETSLIIDIAQCNQHLERLPWYRRWFFKKSLNALQLLLGNYKQLYDTDQKWKQEKKWHTRRTEILDAMGNGLQSILLEQLPFLSKGLIEPNTILLEAVLVYSNDTPLFERFQQKELDAESEKFPLLDKPEILEKALTDSQLFAWAATNNMPLEKILKRLPIFSPSPEESDTEKNAIKKPQKPYYTKLREALKAWQDDNSSLVNDYLQEVWKRVQEQAKLLAILLHALEQASEPETESFAKLLQALELEAKQNQKPDNGTNIPAEQRANIPAATKRRALSAIIEGTGQQELEQAINNWLKHKRVYYSLNIPKAIAGMKDDFGRILQILQVLPQTQLYSNWLELVNVWAKVLLQETLDTQSPDVTKLWEILERSRIALVNLTKHLDGLNESIRQNLRHAFKESLETLKNLETRTKEQEDPAQQKYDVAQWPPLKTWLEMLEERIPSPPSIADCQAQLASGEALVQLFLDPIKQQLRVLWLDQQGLKLREDLPEDCASQDFWIEKQEGSVIAQWTKYFTQWKETQDKERNKIQDWETVMKLAPVKSLAKTLTEWAQGGTLTVIFPPTLGQLPWEIWEPPEDLEPPLKPLGDVLVREVSIEHWFKHKNGENKGQSTQDNSTPWVFNDPKGIEHCMPTQAQWVRERFHKMPTQQETKPSFFQKQQHLTTQSDTQDTLVFNALQNLKHCQQAHLAVHGQFDRYNPIASHLQLTRGIYFPLWLSTAIRTSADLVVLPVCESNLNGQDTEGLLAPIGIGPCLASAGAKTVVGTLWSCSAASALYFSYYFYTIAEENPDKPWHEVAKLARQKLRKMSIEEFERIAKEEFKLDLKNRQKTFFEKLIDWFKWKPTKSNLDLENSQKAEAYATSACETSLSDIRNYINDLKKSKEKLQKLQKGKLPPPPSKPPFEDFWSWAGFIVLGQVARK